MNSTVVARTEHFLVVSFFSFLKDFITFADVFRTKETEPAAIAQLVEHQLPKLRVTSSNLACRS